MAGQQQNAKKGKSRRVSKSKIARYWLENNPRNMTRRAIKVYKTIMKRRAKQKKDMDIARQDAEVEAKRCASKHGPTVEANLHRYFKAL